MASVRLSAGGGLNGKELLALRLMCNSDPYYLQPTVYSVYRWALSIYGGSMTNSSEQVNNHGRGKDKKEREMHPNSLKNLENRKTWKKGESGNPNGQSITSRQKEKMSEPCPFDGQGRTWLEALAEGGMRQSLTTTVALSNLQDRHEGKVTQPIGGEGGQPIKTEIIVSSDAAKKLLTEIIKGISPHAANHD